MSGTSSYTTEIHEVRAFDGSHLPAPVNTLPAQLNAKLSLEIGAGVGMHAINFAKNNPEFTHIAIERTQNKFLKMKNSAEIHKLDNLSVLRDDGVNYVTHNCVDSSIDKVFFLYPNPYPKNSSARWVRMPFFRLLLDKLKPGGEIVLATNIKDYAEEATAYATLYWKLSIEESVKLGNSTTDQQFKARTHFEQKYLESGQICYSIVFQKPISDESLA